MTTPMIKKSARWDMEQVDYTTAVERVLTWLRNMLSPVDEVTEVKVEKAYDGWTAQVYWKEPMSNG